jgi:CPA1 family monovalent cation:H+ antiporter
MTSTIQILILLLIVIVVISVVASRLKVPPSILLVLAGVILALVPGLPAVTLAPEVVLLLVLPPLIYSSSVAMSWREFRFNLRPISMLAVGCVLFTTIAVAAASHWLLRFPWAVGFVLGAIVSPPDPVAPLSIARRLRLPRRLLVILEGEGLANDATALILYRFAVAAVSAGSFSLSQAVGMFAAIIAGEILWGIGVGWFMLRVRRWVSDPRSEIILAILTPFLAYWPPQMLGGSGVLATVTTGLYISWNGLRLISAATRLQGIFFWDFLVYVIEGMVFLITGLQARALIADFHHYSIYEHVISAVVLSGAVIITRFVWIYPATYLPRWLIPAIARKDPAPPWQWPFALGFTGIRGIVSLAAALAIPLTTATNEPFPHRDMILFLAFSVILVTLVGQGLTLPLVIRWLGLANAGRREHHADRAEELKAQVQAIDTALARLDQLAKDRELPEEAIQSLREYHQDRRKRVDHRSDGDAHHKRLIDLLDDIELLLIGTERDKVNNLYYLSELKDEARRRIERGLDLREVHVINLQAEE